MKIAAVKMLLIALIGITTSGCSGIYFSQCKTPDVKYPDINNTKCTTFECVHDKNLINYEAMKKYAQDLFDANEVCK